MSNERSPIDLDVLAIFAPKVGFNRRFNHMPQALIILSWDGLLNGVGPKLGHGQPASNEQVGFQVSKK